MTDLPALNVASINIPVSDIERSRTWFREGHELSFYAVTQQDGVRADALRPVRHVHT